MSDTPTLTAAERIPGAVVARPFIKWTGGKRWLAPRIVDLFRASGATRYYEPFLGGGAVFFALRNAGLVQPENCFLSDANEELINAYRVVRDQPNNLIAALAKYRVAYSHTPERTYYEERQEIPHTDLWRAARFIFLNKTGHGGLYRVNAKGEFNVPWGRYKNPAICDAENLRACSAALQGVDLRSGPYQAWVPTPRSGKPDCFLYVDPPYDGTFTGYTAGGFDTHAQRQLADDARWLAENGATVVVSNADTPLIRDLYPAPLWQVEQVYRKGTVNSDGAKRQPVAEVLVTSAPAQFVRDDWRGRLVGEVAG